MFTREIVLISDIAKSKYNISKEKPGKYFMRSVVAGFYLIIAIILSFSTAAVLYDTYPQVARIIHAVCFSIGISLIVFLGGELFTGNNLIMAMGAYEKKITWAHAVRVWFLSYIGNFVGTCLLGFLFVKSGASFDIIKEYIRPIVETKLQIPDVQVVIRAILCNFMVCIAILTSIRMKSESGKIIIMFWLIFAFVISGLEHSIANMGIYTMAYFMLGGLPMGLVLKSMILVTIGNIIGGAFLLALPLKLMSIEEHM